MAGRFDPRYPTSDAGEFKHRITFLEQTIVTDESGSAPSWAAGTPPDVTWAKIDQPGRGFDKFQSGQEVSQVDAVVTIRYNPRRPRQANMRFQDASGNTYLILGITKPKGMNVLLVMPCLLVGGNG